MDVRGFPLLERNLGTGDREMMGEETLVADLSETLHIGVCPVNLMD